MKETFRSLRNRNFRLFFFGQLISNTGNWLTNVAITLLVLKITGSGVDVGLLAAFQYGPILFLSAWAGAIADRVDKRKMLFITQSFEMAQSFGLAIVAFMPHPPIAALYILAGFGGIFLSFDNPLRRSFVSEMAPPDDLANAVVLYSTTMNVPRILGPALAGLLIVTTGYGWCFAIDAFTYIAVLIALAMMRTEDLHRRAPKERTKGEIREGLRYVLGTPLLLINFTILALIGVMSYNFTVTLPLFVHMSLGGGDTAFTVLYSIFSAGAVVCTLIVARRNWVKMNHIILGAAALGITMLVLAATTNIVFAAAAMFLVGMSSILYMTATTTLVQTESKHEMHGRVLALQLVLLIGTTPIGGPISGWLADAFGARVPIVIGGVVALIAAGWGWLQWKRKPAFVQNVP